MKKLIILLSLTSAFFLQSCEKKGPGDNYDFSNSLPAYVEITTKTNLGVVQGNSATIALRLKTAVQQDVVVSYSVTGAFSTTGTVTIPRDGLTANAVVAVPAGIVPAASASATAVFKITGAKKGTEDLSIGALGANSNEIRNIVVGKNLIGVTSDAVSIKETIADQTIKVPITITSALKSQTSLTYTLVPKAGNSANNLELISANPLVIAAGATTATIEIKVKDNLTLNADNVYELRLTGATAPVGSEVSINADKALYTITVTDDLKTVGFATTTAVDVTASGNRNFEVKLSAPSSAAITVPYSIEGGVVGTDYILRTTGTLTFPAGTTTSNINLDILPTYVKGKVLKIKLDSITGDVEASLGTAKELTVNLK
ncbi:hypothetical protein [Pedobacter sp. GR22-6]|uniref:hypothetical protein n=1 Tax=Pedobacter sp. GR22-6 TaxID=3127957 RepID=UPI00307EB5B4